MSAEKVKVHVDQLRAVPAPIVGIGNQKALHAADQTREGTCISDKDEGVYDLETSNDEHARSVLRHAITFTHVNSSQGLTALAVEVVTGETEGNKSCRTCVLRAKATTAFKVGKINLSPFGGNIVEIVPGEKKKVYQTNPSQLATIAAQVTTGTLPVTSTRVVAKVAITRNYNIVSPLVDFNAKKRKFDEEDGLKCLRAVAPYWAILHAPPGEEGNMKFISKQVGEKGYNGQDLPPLKTAEASRVDIPYLTNTKLIQPGDILLLPPRA